MRLKEITMQNFKQYYGKQSIVLAGQNEGDDTNVTVVYGDNGRGKTTLYRSLLFGFYGDKELEQDEQEGNKESIIYLANLKALDEAYDRGEGIEVNVNIQFTHNNEDFELIRGFSAIKDDSGRIFEDLPTVRLIRTYEKGNTESIDNPDEIEDIINSILDERVKNYFLFDGERIETLTRATKKQRENIQKGIKNLLQIDNLYLLRDALEKNRKNLLAELKKISTGEMLKNLEDIKRVDNDIALALERKSYLDKELEIGEQERDEINNRLKDSEEKRPIIDKILQLEETINNLNSQLNTTKQKLVENSSSFSVLPAKELIGDLIFDLEDKRVKGEIPSEIKTELIDRLLGELKCICGREIDLDSIEYEKLLDWKKVSNTQLVEKHAMSLFGNLKETANHIQNHSKSLSSLIEDFARIEEQIDIYNDELETKKQKVGDINHSNMVSDFDYREKLVEKLVQLRMKIEEVNNQIVSFEEEKKELLKKQNSLATENELQRQMKKQSVIINKSIEALDEIIGKFVKEIREELEEKANLIFKNLIDTGGATNLKKLVVNDNYTLDVLDWSGRPFLANISAGQRQIVSLSFITALAEVAGGSSTLEIPLFMDTPFGRLSPDHRENLVRLIPTITPQWILLVTGSEFREEEEGKYLLETGKWGKFYYLDAIEEGITKIKEYNPSELTKIKTLGQEVKI
ncbi:AAA family ATPase [Sutcliffiella cohnii]